ncbi:MAG: ABC-F family ATP-binding cassette domain-containing protein [Flavobacteriales bacterium]|nr:ABC-F family ATP-binding cassette domain-containing protein [Flavobacteriales bacterium]MCB9194339.1 ABC-F family ATP-binding cassette domain-containing protein [Flavobacteriales bacterium]
MNVLSVERLSKRYGPRELFNAVSFGLEKGQRMAVIARNGAGKSTLLRCIAGLEKPDAGQVTFNKGVRIAYLPQDVRMTGDRSLVDEMLDRDDPVSNAIRAYEHAVARHAPPSELQRCIDRVEELQAWDHEARARSLLYQFGLRDLEQAVNTLSGGQQKRLALARTLLSDPDVLVLDEPTNHLDLDMIEQLEAELTRSGLTVLLVTHDRYFLDNVCDEIVELENGSLDRFKGDYSYYVEKKALAEGVKEATQQKLQTLMRQELEWVRRMPRARGTKSKSRLAAFDVLKEAAGRRHREEGLRIEVKMERLGGKVIEVRNLVKRFGERSIVEKFNYSLKRGDRIGIVGPNGVGKSTFIELITGRMRPDMGKVTIGETVVLGVFDQQGLQLEEDRRVIDVVRDIAEVIPLTKGRTLSAAQLLERFLFDREKQWQFASTLSGGERRRLHLCTVLMRNPNVLLLDEPTNDLDIAGLNALEDFLVDLDACILVVTHDRFFLDKVCDRLLVFEGAGTIKEHVGTFTELREQQKVATSTPARTSAPDPPTAKPKARPRKITYAERLELERLESEIPQQENRRDDLITAMNDPALGHEELARRSLDLEQVLRQLERMSDRWIELSDKADAAD